MKYIITCTALFISFNALSQDTIPQHKDTLKQIESTAIQTPASSTQKLNDTLFDVAPIVQHPVEEKVEAMDHLIDKIGKLEAEKSNIKKQLLKKNHTQQEQEKLVEKAQIVDQQIESNQGNLDIISTGIDQSLFEEEVVDKDINLSKELGELIHPYVKDVKEVINKPKELEKFKNKLSTNIERIGNIEKALIKLEKLLAESDNRQVNDHLLSQIKFLKNKRKDLLKSNLAIEVAINDIKAENSGFLEVLMLKFKYFIKGHGKNLFLAMLAMFLTFFSLRFIHKLIRSRVSIAKHRNWKSVIRLVDLFYFIFTVLISITFFILVLLSASDWLLLGLFLIIFASLIWVGKNAIPIFIEQVKLLLGLGTVREGERVMYNGTPWIVDSISLYSYLSNPDLKDHQIILPLKDLVDLRSRPFTQEEPWFPSKLGDWVRLDDGIFGKILDQSPDFIELLVDRGSLKTYSILNYLSSNPQNLTRCGFAITKMVGIHYKYRYTINNEICVKLEQNMYEKVKASEYGNFLEFLSVELDELNSSSIDIEVVVKFSGGAAYDFLEIPGKIQQFMLDCLNAMDIEIPYPHLTLDGLPSRLQ